ncbi:hypothetical protein E2C01_045630 [Portunus trituberculatus]|uniref:Uncharacterized protein n=1 Tax=Portunus trituberculatus TaxID=210409 RepID=A0A5B7G2J6_PORTR|nr:hypothetical protein [Portunus trituberculatus]
MSLGGDMGPNMGTTINKIAGSTSGWKYDDPDSRTGQFSMLAYNCRNDWEHFRARRTRKMKDVRHRILGVRWRISFVQ